MKRSTLLTSVALTTALATLLVQATASNAMALSEQGPGVSASDTIVSFDVSEGTSMAVSASPDGRFLAIDLQGSIWIVPSEGGRARRITDVFNDARQPVWSPDGKTIAFFAYRDGGYDLWSIAPDGSGQKKLTTGPFDDRDPVWSPDGSRIAFASDRGEPGKSSYNIWTLELSSGRLEQVTSNAYENRLPTWSPDGRQIAYSSTRDGISGIWATQTSDHSERELRRSTGRIDAPSWSPDGRLAYVVQEGAESRLEIDGAPVSGSENVFPFRASWRPGDGFYYVSDGKIRRRSNRTDRVSTVEFVANLQVARPAYVHTRRDFDSTKPRRALGIVRPSISPDGSRIAFAALGDLYVVPTTGGAPVNLTRDRFLDTDPAWSPDGGRLVYSSDKGGGLPQLWIRDLATGQDRRLTTLDTQPIEAVWSPDGTRIAFIDANGQWGVAGLAVVDVETGQITRLSPTLGQPGRPTWSGDGKQVAVSLSLPFSGSFREGTNQIYVAQADGQGTPKWQIPIPNLSIDTRGGGGPVWSPDGTKMAAIYEGVLRVWPVSPDGSPLGPPRSITTEIAHSPSWAGDSRTILYQSNDRLKRVDIETGVVTDTPLDLTYTLAKPAGRTVVHAGRLVDAIRDETQHDRDIVIEGNRIVDVRPHDPALHAQADRVVDGSGLTAIPGLIDYHAHVQKDFGADVHRAWLAFGVTTVRDPGNQPYHGIEDREASEAGVRIGPRIYTTGNLLEWQRVYYKMGVAISGPAHLELELERARALHFDLLKSYVRLPDLQQRRAVEFAHNELGVPVSTHEIFPAAFVGVDGTEHLGATSRRGYSPKQGPLARSYGDVIGLFGHSGRWITPTNFGALSPYLEAHPTLRNDPRIDLYPTWAQASVRTVRPATPQSIAARAGNAEGIKDLFDAGARVVAGTDSQIAINLHAEIASYVDAGLTPFQALQSATSTPAELLGLDAGVIAPGKLADIVLVRGDPRDDIANTVNVSTVISNGKVFDLNELLKQGD